MVKRITVCVVEYASTDGNTGTTPLAEQEVGITIEGGFDAAVRVAFPPFPNNCQRVVLPRLRLELWNTGNKQWRHTPAEAYALVQEGDVVVIHKRVSVVGPDPLIKGWVPDGAGGVGDHPLPACGKPTGPQHARARRVRALLRQLELL
jgi:hypothetical protein